MIVIVTDDPVERDDMLQALDSMETRRTVVILPTLAAADRLFVNLPGEARLHLLWLNDDERDSGTHAFVRKMRIHPKFRDAPILLWASSVYERRLGAARAELVNAYIQKPLEALERDQVFKDTIRFFGQGNLVPDKEEKRWAA